MVQPLTQMVLPKEKGSRFILGPHFRVCRAYLQVLKFLDLFLVPWLFVMIVCCELNSCTVLIGGGGGIKDCEIFDGGTDATGVDGVTGTVCVVSKG